MVVKLNNNSKTYEGSIRIKDILPSEADLDPNSIIDVLSIKQPNAANQTFDLDLNEFIPAMDELLVSDPAVRFDEETKRRIESLIQTLK